MEVGGQIHSWRMSFLFFSYMPKPSSAWLLVDEANSSLATERTTHSHVLHGPIPFRARHMHAGDPGPRGAARPSGSRCSVDLVDGGNIPPCSEPTCPQAGADGNRWRRASRSSQIARASGQPDHLIRTCWTGRTPLDTSFFKLKGRVKVRNNRGNLVHLRSCLP